MQYAWLTIRGCPGTVKVYISHGQGYYDVVLEYAWLMIHGCPGIVRGLSDHL